MNAGKSDDLLTEFRGPALRQLCMERFQRRIVQQQTRCASLMLAVRRGRGGSGEQPESRRKRKTRDWPTSLAPIPRWVRGRCNRRSERHKSLEPPLIPSRWNASSGFFLQSHRAIPFNVRQNLPGGRLMRDENADSVGIPGASKREMR